MSKYIQPRVDEVVAKTVWARATNYHKVKSVGYYVANWL